MDSKKSLPMIRKTKKWLFLYVVMGVTEEVIDHKTTLAKASEILLFKARDWREQ